MQIVGRDCELCHETLKSERDAVGCERCELAVHDLCVARTREQYREPPAKPGRKRARSTICPRCGDDLRALQRERERERDAIIATAQRQRRRKKALRNVGVGMTFLTLWLAFRMLLALAGH